MALPAACHSRDLTDEKWALIEPFLPKLARRKDGRGRPWRETRAVLAGILWILRTGAPWADLPDQYPSYQTCHRRSSSGCGVLKGILSVLAEALLRRGLPRPAGGLHRRREILHRLGNPPFDEWRCAKCRASSDTTNGALLERTWLGQHRGPGISRDGQPLNSTRVERPFAGRPVLLWLDRTPGHLVACRSSLLGFTLAGQVGHCTSCGLLAAVAALVGARVGACSRGCRALPSLRSAGAASTGLQDRVSSPLGQMFVGGCVQHLSRRSACTDRWRLRKYPRGRLTRPFKPPLLGNSQPRRQAEILQYILQLFSANCPVQRPRVVDTSIRIAS